MGEASNAAPGAPYRVDASETTAPLSILYAPFSFIVLLRPVFLLVASVWVMVGLVREGARAAVLLEIGGLVLAGIGYLAYSLPLVRIQARMVGGQVVLRGCRWPGTEKHWSLDLDEAGQFEVETVDTDQGSFYRLALRTTHGPLLPLTENAYRGVTFIYTRVLARLNGWLAAARNR